MKFVAGLIVIVTFIVGLGGYLECVYQYQYFSRFGSVLIIVAFVIGMWRDQMSRVASQEYLGDRFTLLDLKQKLVKIESRKFEWDFKLALMKKNIGKAADGVQEKFETASSDLLDGYRELPQHLASTEKDIADIELRYEGKEKRGVYTQGNRIKPRVFSIA